MFKKGSKKKTVSILQDLPNDKEINTEEKMQTNDNK